MLTYGYVFSANKYSADHIVLIFSGSQRYFFVNCLIQFYKFLKAHVRNIDSLRCTNSGKHHE